MASRCLGSPGPVFCASNWSLLWRASSPRRRPATHPGLVLLFDALLDTQREVVTHLPLGLLRNFVFTCYVTSGAPMHDRPAVPGRLCSRAYILSMQVLSNPRRNGSHPTVSLTSYWRLDSCCKPTMLSWWAGRASHHCGRLCNCRFHHVRVRAAVSPNTQTRSLDAPAAGSDAPATSVVQRRCLHRAASFPSLATLACRSKFGQGPCATKRPRGKRVIGHTWLKRETPHHVAQETAQDCTTRARHKCLRVMSGAPILTALLREAATQPRARLWRRRCLG